MLCSVPIEVSVAERARWLAELSDTLDTALELVLTLDVRGERRDEALDLYLRIEAARLEIHSLRLSRSLHPRSEIRPERIGSPPWDRPAAGGF